MKDGKVYLWNIATEEKVAFDPEHADNIFALHPNGGGWARYNGQDKLLKNGLQESTGDTGNSESRNTEKPSDKTVSKGKGTKVKN